jgi:hypothetical protein
VRDRIRSIQQKINFSLGSGVIYNGKTPFGDSSYHGHIREKDRLPVEEAGRMIEMNVR